MTRLMILLSLLAATSLPLAGCEKKGPAERMGEKIDEAVESVTQGEEGALEKAGRKVDDAVEDAKEKLNDK